MMMKSNGGMIVSAVRGVMISMRDLRCDRCHSVMKAIQPCHMKCFNCGAEMDCSDKGSTWET